MNAISYVNCKANVEIEWCLEVYDDSAVEEFNSEIRLQ